MEQNIKIGPVLDVLVTTQHVRYGNEVMNDDWFIGEGWINILNCYQQECWRLCKGAFDGLRACNVCSLRYRQFGKTWRIHNSKLIKPVYNNTDVRDIPTDEQRCQHVPSEDRVSPGRLSISRRMTFLLPHAVNLPEQHGRILWDTAIQIFHGVWEHTVSLTFDEKEKLSD